jgi:beta-glucuronidase
MFSPQQNDFRNMLDLSGLWEFQIDPQGMGETAGWIKGLPAPRPIATPASWNEQFQDTHDYLEPAWYLRRFFAPGGWQGQRIFVRFGSVNYAAAVWLNGQLLGEHEGGHLPFDFEVADALRWGQENTLAVRVEARLTPTRVPPGDVSAGGLFNNFPPSSFDFFPFAGIQRPVVLHTLPERHIEDVTVTTAIDGADGLVTVLATQNGADGRGRVRLSGAGAELTGGLDFNGGKAQATLRVPQARLWGPADPHLYALTITLEDDGQVIDRYFLEIGVRTVEVVGDRLLLNGQPIFLTGFGRHEDFPVHGRGLDLPVAVKDHNLIQWVGANSYRTSHYPYAEEQMQLADRLGILVIDETPAVGLFFEDDEASIAERLRVSREQLAGLVQRDKNHPCVIAWSVANEPLPPNLMQRMRGQDRSPVAPETTVFFQTLIDDAHRLDPTRPVTLAGIGGCPLDWLALCDMVMINRYYGWYSQSGQLDAGAEALARELDALHARFGKPIIISEFGADTLPGVHSDPPTLWSEEYQVEFLRRYLDVAATRPFVAGLHVWNLADFKTAQAIMRAGGMNHKGVFTRDRQPKMAAHFLRSRWSKAERRP